MLLRARTTVGTLARGLRLQTGAEHRLAARAVAATMSLPPLPRRRRMSGQVWAVGMVKNETDIVFDAIGHLLGQGVDHVLVADNGSTDGTLEGLRELAAGDARVHVAVDSEPRYLQSHKTDLLARAAGRSGADWVVPFDADEFWFAPKDQLAQWLRTCDLDVVEASIFNAFPTGRPAHRHLRDDGDTTPNWAIDPTPARQRKVAFRAHPWARLEMGNHGVDRPGRRAQRPLLRILHLPWRSEAQLMRKLRQGAAAFRGTSESSNVGGHWRQADQLSDTDLSRMWDAVTAGQPVPRLHWSPQGTLIPAEVTAWQRWDPQGLLPGGSQ